MDFSDLGGKTKQSKTSYCTEEASEQEKVSVFIPKYNLILSLIWKVDIGFLWWRCFGVLRGPPEVYSVQTKLCKLRIWGSFHIFALRSVCLLLTE